LQRFSQPHAYELFGTHLALDDYRQQIETLFAQHPDPDLFSRPVFWPNGGRIVIGSTPLRRGHATAGPRRSVINPVPVRKVRRRAQCNPVLRHTLYLWANLSRCSCPWDETYYQTLRARGKSHSCALRCLGQRWLKILWKRWQTRTRYDAELHQQNQLQHGSWVLKLQNA
jgi:hypothetical protein